MNVDDIVGNLAALMDVDIPLHAREQLAKELEQRVLLEHQRHAEKQGIGADATLSPKVLYSVQDVLDADTALRQDGDWFLQYCHALYCLCYPPEE
ncbi:MAG: hypothetical protein M3255_09950 [Pseudomonadota bacterium]|nr:hypothetical protein [Pseudomonadota bacterium]